jgi:hypothetical protein
MLHKIKSISILLLVLILFEPSTLMAGDGNVTSVVFRQYNYQETPIYNHSVPGLKMRKVGMGLTIAGGACLITGIALFASAITTSRPNSQTNFQGAIGLLFCLPGVGLTIPGGIVWGVGERKLRNYRNNMSRQVTPIILEKNDSETIPSQERY